MNMGEGRGDGHLLFVVGHSFSSFGWNYFLFSIVQYTPEESYKKFVRELKVDFAMFFLIHWALS